MSQWQLPSCESLRKMKKPLNSGRTNERALLLASDCASFRLFMLPLTLYVCTCMFNRCSRYLFHLQNADGKPLEGTDEDYEGARRMRIWRGMELCPWLGWFFSLHSCIFPVEFKNELNQCRQHPHQTNALHSGLSNFLRFSVEVWLPGSSYGSSWPNQSNPNLIFIIRFHPVVAAAGRPSARGAYSVNADRRNPADPRAGRSCPGARHLRSQRWGQGTLARCFLGEYLFEVKIMGDYVTLHLQVRVKMNRMRLRIAQRLKDAQNTYVMLTTFNEIDMRFVVLLEIESTE